jgi:hypothetical protein
MQARGEYLLGRLAQFSNETNQAAAHYAAAKRSLDAMRQESGGDSILKRLDFQAISSAAGAHP